MNILIVEYFTGGGLCGRTAHRELPPALCREGDLMLRALLRDLAEVEGLYLTTTRDARLHTSALGPVAVQTVNADEEWTPRLRALLEASDAFWPIAPETDGALAALCELCEQSGCLLLNSSAEAVRCAASKHATFATLEQAGLPCVETRRAGEALDRFRGDEKIVLKPDDGVGCEDMRLVTASQMFALMRDGDVAQPYIEGEAASLSILYGGGYRLVGVNRQEIERCDGGFSLTGCVVNGLRNSVHDFDSMAKVIGQTIPGLAGYVGVDCVVRDHDVRIIEINPRLTTSYVGLSLSLGANPAAWVISLLTQGTAPRVELGSAAEVRVAL